MLAAPPIKETPMRGTPILVTAAVLAASLTTTATAAKKPPRPLKANSSLTGITVFAAASLAQAFPAAAPKARYSFAGSDQLAFQIEQGAPADVFASANVKYPDALYRKGLVEKPRVFAYNVLVVIVPKANPARIRTVGDLARPGVKLVIGDETVPVGSYTRSVFTRLRLDAALGNVVSNEPDVRGVVTKVALGEADAGVAYWTDFVNQRRRVAYIPIPASAQPTVAYSIAVSKGARNPARARAFVRYLGTPMGKRWLVRFGFRVPR